MNYLIQTPRFLSQLALRMGVNDFLFVVLLCCLSLDLRQRRNWEAFDSFDQPIRSWLFGTYFFAALIRAIYLMGGAYVSNDFGWSLSTGRLGDLAWLLLAMWTVAGTLWTLSSRAHSILCLSERRHFLLVVSWI